MVPQDTPREGRLFAEGDRGEAGAFEPEGEAADAAKQVKDEHKSDLGKNA